MYRLEEIARSAADGQPIVPVGTTSARTLESVYWAACGLGDDAAALRVLGHSWHNTENPSSMKRCGATVMWYSYLEYPSGT